jgi:hypothetical protein
LERNSAELPDILRSMALDAHVVSALRVLPLGDRPVVQTRRESAGHESTPGVLASVERESGVTQRKLDVGPLVRVPVGVFQETVGLLFESRDQDRLLGLLEWPERETRAQLESTAV